MDQKVIEDGKRALAIQHGVSMEDLDYIGHTDCSMLRPGAVMLQYNIMLVGHQKHKSTVAYKHGWD